MLPKFSPFNLASFCLWALFLAELFPPKIYMLGVLTPANSECAVFGDRLFKEVIRQNEVVRVIGSWKVN